MVALASLSFVVASCSWKNPETVKHFFKKGKHTVSVVQKDNADSSLSKKKFEHPHTFTKSEVFQNLISLKYRKLALFSGKENIFRKKIANEISPIFVNAFKKASNKDLVEFDVRSKSGRISGDIFIFKGKMNWRFDIINDASYEKRNSRDYLDSWKLALQKGQKYHGEKEFFGVKVDRNWIIYPLGKTWVDDQGSTESLLKAVSEEDLNEELDDVGSSPTPDLEEVDLKELPGEDGSLGKGEVEAQFQRLKKLMEKGLITKEEYKSKKKELLKRYF